MRSITKQSDGIRGERSILLSQHRELIRNIELNADLTFSSIVSTKFTTTHAAGRTSATFNIPVLNVNTAINAPQNATHFRLVQLVGAMSDMVYNTTLKAYEAVDVKNNSISEVSTTDYLPVRGSQPAPVVLETALGDTQERIGGPAWDAPSGRRRRPPGARGR
jgi:hypothetical protein